MLFVLASRSDAPARALVDRWQAAGRSCTLMTCVDLALAGWRVELGKSDRPWRAVAGGRPFSPADVTAVINRLPAVTAREIDFIDAADRVYAASEMNAFLLAWLAGLSCPVLNQPTPAALNGPLWPLERWNRSAAEADLPIRPLLRRAVLEAEPRAEPATEPLEELYVIGKKCLGGADAKTRKAALKMAAEAGVELLRVHVEPRKKGADLFVHADYWIDVSRPDVADALWERCSS